MPRALSRKTPTRKVGRLVGAVALDVSSLLATVADALVGGLRRAVTRQVSNLAAVVALLSLCAVTAHVAESAARVASSLTSTTAISTGTTSITATIAAATIATTLSAVTRDVAPLAAFVALLSASSTLGGETSTFLGAVTADVTGSTAAIACLLGLRLGAFAAQVPLLSAIVTGGVTLGRALGCAVSHFAAVVATTATGTSAGVLGSSGEVHCERSVDVEQQVTLRGMKNRIKVPKLSIQLSVRG